ncbi:MAG: F0F1 ATP synthase subunit B [Firmicutes bacterium]|nr:F0F1 ATP synthase subunit B [Bacillota bacterium]
MNPLRFIFLSNTETTSLPMFDLAAQTFYQMVPYLISFGVLVFFFAKFLYKPVKEILQKRADTIAANIKEAAESKATAEELKALYDQKLRDIEAERNAILDEARKEASARVSQILGEAKIEAQEAKDRANRDIIAEQERVKTQIQQAIIDISTDMASKLISVTIDRAAQDKLFAEAMNELEATAFKPY